MLSSAELPTFMQGSLIDAYKRMKTVTTSREFKQLINIAPAFIFVKMNDYIRATQADSIVILVPPDRHYEFEILCHDPDRNRIVVNSVEFKLITEESFKDLIMDHYPMVASL